MDDAKHPDLLTSMPLPALALCLLWWGFVNPAAYTSAKQSANADGLTRLYRAMHWLISTLLIAFPIIPLLGTVTRVQSKIPAHVLLLILLGAWLLSQVYTPDAMLSPFRTITIALIAFLVAYLTNVTLSMSLILISGVALFAIFEDDLMIAPPRQNQHHWSSNLIAVLFALPILISILLVIALSLTTSAAGFSAAALAAVQANASVKKQKANPITILTVVLLPVAYAVLIWLCWFGV